MGKQELPGIGELRGCGEDRFLAPGTKVCITWQDDEGDGEPEVGVVVHCWQSDKINVHDCYVAFFGSEFPNGEPAGKPYVLRYAATSLGEVVE